MPDKLQISKSPKLKGEDGFKTFSVRIKEDIVEKLDTLAAETSRSRNELINIILKYGVENCEITEPNED